MNKKNGLILLLIGLLALGFVFFKSGLFVNEKDLKFVDIIESPDKNLLVKYGQNFDLTLNEEKLKSRDSITIKLDKNKSIVFNGQYILNIPTETLGLGPHFIEVTTWKKGNSKTVTLPFKIISDVLPTPSMFSVVRKIEHDSKAYTQGWSGTMDFYTSLGDNMANL